MKSKTAGPQTKIPAPKSKARAWRYTHTEESELLYLSLAARHHCGQQQSSQSGVTKDGQDSSDDDEAAEGTHVSFQGPPIDPSEATTSVDTAHNRMKERFLDNFAELLARRKDARYVSCCALVEFEKKARIFVSRNAGFQFDRDGKERSEGVTVDSTFFDQFREQVSGLRKAYTTDEPHPADTTDKEDALFELLVGYYMPRLKHHIEEFGTASKGSKKQLGESSGRQNKRILEFARFRNIAVASAHEALDVERAQELALAAYKLTRSSEVKPALHRVFEADTADRVLRQLRYIARIRAIHLSITDCAQALPIFGKIDIVPIPHKEPEPVARNSISDAHKAALRSLEEYVGYVPTWIHDPTWPVKLEADYYGRPLIVHTEIAMAMFFEQNKQYTPVPYLGISKKTCYLCHQFLSQLRSFGTRASHDHLHPYWTLPIRFQVRKQKFHSPARVLGDLKQKLCELIGRTDVSNLAYRPQSTAVWSGRPPISSGPASLTASRLSHFEEPEQTSTRPLPSTGVSGKAKVVEEPLVESNAASWNTFDSLHAATIPDDGGETCKLLKSKLDFMTRLLQVYHDDLPAVIQTALPLLQLEALPMQRLLDPLAYSPATREWLDLGQAKSLAVCAKSDVTARGRSSSAEDFREV